MDTSNEFRAAAALIQSFVWPEKSAFLFCCFVGSLETDSVRTPTVFVRELSVKNKSFKS